jgi:hypothetical protein
VLAGAIGDTGAVGVGGGGGDGGTTDWGKEKLTGIDACLLVWYSKTSTTLYDDIRWLISVLDIGLFPTSKLRVKNKVVTPLASVPEVPLNVRLGWIEGETACDTSKYGLIVGIPFCTHPSTASDPLPPIMDPSNDHPTAT